MDLCKSVINSWDVYIKKIVCNYNELTDPTKPLDGPQVNNSLFDEEISRYKNEMQKKYIKHCPHIYSGVETLNFSLL